MKVGEPLWREVWKSFLPVLRKHLKEKGWFDRALLGFDEKPEKIMKLIFDFIVAEAPDFKVASSGGYPGDKRKMGDEIVFHIDELVDRERWAEIEPIVRRMHEDENRYITWYTACMPHYPNTFLFSSLRESRLIGWLTWKYGFDGYTRWAVNAYPEDVWNQPLFKWPPGTCFSSGLEKKARWTVCAGSCCARASRTTRLFGSPGSWQRKPDGRIFWISCVVRYAPGRLSIPAAGFRISGRPGRLSMM